MRLLKLVALLGFVMPWFVISCAGKTFVEPRGYELALGLKIEAGEDFAPPVTAATPIEIQLASISPTPIQPPPAVKRPAREAPALIQWLAGGALVLLLATLTAGLWLKGGAFFSLAAGAGFAAAGLAYASVAGVEMELQKTLIEMARDNPLGALAVAQLDIKLHVLPGHLLTVGSALFAGLLATLGLWRLWRRSTNAGLPSQP